jgi:hypothetical protein
LYSTPEDLEEVLARLKPIALLAAEVIHAAVQLVLRKLVDEVGRRRPEPNDERLHRQSLAGALQVLLRGPFV